MTYKGRIIGLSLMFINFVFWLSHNFFNYGVIERWRLILFAVLLVISWYVGGLFDKIKIYNIELKQTQKELQSLFDNSKSFLWTIDEIEKKVMVSKGIEEIFGYTVEEFEKNFELWLLRTHTDDMKKVQKHYQEILSGSPSKCEWRFFREDGEMRWLEAFGNPIFNNSGDLIKLNGVAYDITERKEFEEKLEHIAYHDNLTGLPNRTMLNISLKKTLARCKRKNQKMAVMFLDLDSFKFINDTMGHGSGDELLKQVSNTLVESVREGDVVVRQGGDEFIILLEDIEKPEIHEIAQRIINKFTSPFILKEEELFTSPSIGISLFPEDGKNIDTLIKYADTAMYLAKKRGKNNYQFYIHENEDILKRNIKLEQGIKKALYHQEFELHYQPKVNIESGNIYGVEALLRWNHPKLGLISPTEFIPIAENTGMIIPIGKWVLEEACKQNKMWQDSGLRIKMAVNVSPLQFENHSVVDLVKKVLDENQLSPEYLSLEITESVMQNLNYSTSIIQELKNLGIKVAIDDFGTGYSSLSVLNDLPIDTVKIDKSFVNDMMRNSNTAVLVKNIINLSNDLGFNLVAEGIENEQQVNFLVGNGCCSGQGYFYSPPIPALKVEKFLKDQFVTETI